VTGRDEEGYLEGCSIVLLFYIYRFSDNLLCSYCRTASEHQLTTPWVVLSEYSRRQLLGTCLPGV